MIFLHVFIGACIGTGFCFASSILKKKRKKHRKYTPQKGYYTPEGLMFEIEIQILQDNN